VADDPTQKTEPASPPAPTLHEITIGGKTVRVAAEDLPHLTSVIDTRFREHDERLDQLTGAVVSRSEPRRDVVGDELRPPDVGLRSTDPDRYHYEYDRYLEQRFERQKLETIATIQADADERDARREKQESERRQQAQRERFFDAVFRAYPELEDEDDLVKSTVLRHIDQFPATLSMNEGVKRAGKLVHERLLRLAQKGKSEDRPPQVEGGTGAPAATQRAESTAPVEPTEPKDTLVDLIKERNRRRREAGDTQAPRRSA
jgi:hypothetical protein